MSTTGRAHRHRDVEGDGAVHDQIETAYQLDTAAERLAVQTLKREPPPGYLFRTDDDWRARPGIMQEWARDYLLVRIFELLKVVAED